MVVKLDPWVLWLKKQFNSSLRRDGILVVTFFTHLILMKEYRKSPSKLAEIQARSSYDGTFLIDSQWFVATVHEACYTACCVSVPLVSRGPRCCIYRWTGRLCSDYSNVGLVCRQKGSLRNVANSHFWIFSLFQPCLFLRFYLITHWRYPLLAMQGLCNDRSSVCLSVCLSVPSIAAAF